MPIRYSASLPQTDPWEDNGHSAFCTPFLTSKLLPCEYPFLLSIFLQDLSLELHFNGSDFPCLVSGRDLLASLVFG